MMQSRGPRRALAHAIVAALAMIFALAVPPAVERAAATTPTLVIAGDDPAVTGDQWGLLDGYPTGGYYSQLRSLLTNSAYFGPSGTVNASFTIRSTPVTVPLTTGALDGVDVYFLSARDAPTAAEVTVLQAFVQRGGALVVSSNAPGFFDNTQWLGFTLTPRVVFGDGALGFTTTHKSPKPSTVTNTSHPVTSGPFGAVTQFLNWHTVAAFASMPSQAVELARVTNLYGPDNNGSTTGITISGPTLAAIPAKALGPTSGPIIATSDVDTFSNAYDGTAIAYPTDTDCRLSGNGTLTDNGKLALNAFSWIVDQKASLLTPTLTAPATAAAGATTRLSWSGVSSPSARDWIGLYTSSAAPAAAFVAWRYTGGGASGAVDFAVPSGLSGSGYEFRLFSNDGWTVLATSGAVTITASSTSLSRAVGTVNAGASQSVTWAGVATPTARDWIGLYASSTAGDASYLAWRYTTGTAAGTVPFAIPADAPAGTAYELRLFANDSYARLATAPSFAVTRASIGSGASVANPGSTVTASWSGVANPSAKDWIGLYATSGAAESSFVAWRYTTGTASGTVPFVIPAGAAPGSTYELRLFTNDSYSRIGTSAPISVAAPTIAVAPSSVTHGGTTDATWSGVAAPTAKDWIGLYASGTAADSGYLAWRYTSGTAGGTVAFAIPAGAPPGTTYELRLFANDGYVRLATSAPFSVT